VNKRNILIVKDVQRTCYLKHFITQAPYSFKTCIQSPAHAQLNKHCHHIQWFHNVKKYSQKKKPFKFA